ncbi:MAG TPA: dihydroorotase family protein [Candidatus Saccharimonadales bacterium]|nr:dihydroorotase family protein [Candidatus Saccharimonadales bacterium]
MTEILEIPGAVDIHVHLRQPGDNKAETIASGTRAALLGGFTAICDMPNNPGRPTWSAHRLIEKQRLIRKSAYVPVGLYAGAQPESNNLDQLPAMAKPAIGLKLYSAPTTGSDKDYTAKDFTKIVSAWHESAPAKPIMLHAGQTNLPGLIELIAGKFGHHLHVCHVNASREVELVEKAKADGLPVTCGVCPHHLFKTSHDPLSEGWFARMKPPLARQEEAEKLFELLVNGAIDIVETDHAPHSAGAKWTAENAGGSCWGVPGIEFALPLLLYQMVKGRISRERLIEITSTKPAKIIGLKLSGSTKVTWQMEIHRIGDEKTRLSGSGWTPYLGKLAAGKVKKVVIGKQVLVADGKIMAKTGRLINRGDQL